MKSESEKLYAGKKRKSFFRDTEQRNLWIRLNAEHICYCQKVINNIDKQDLGSIDIPYSHLWVSNNQLIYDEYMRDQPRMSLAELSAISHEELLQLSQERMKQTIDELFNKAFDENNDDFIVYGGDEDFI